MYSSSSIVLSCLSFALCVFLKRDSCPFFYIAMQSLGETQIDLGAPALVPPPTSLVVERSHDRRSHSPLVGQEGDINDAVIDNIVEEDSSNGDEEEGKLKILFCEDKWNPLLSTPMLVPINFIFSRWWSGGRRVGGGVSTEQSTCSAKRHLWTVCGSQCPYPHSNLHHCSCGH